MLTLINFSFFCVFFYYNMKNPIQSKKKLKESQRKAKQLMDKKQKIKNREDNIKIIQDNSIDNNLSEILLSSKTLGSPQTLKSRLKNEIKREKYGLQIDEILYNEKIVDKNDWSDPVASKVKIYKPILIKPDSPSSESISQEYIPKIAPIIKPITNHNENETIYIPEPTPELNPFVLMGYTENTQPTSMTIEENTKKTLPITHMEQEIIETIRYNSITIICGETGSGKSTQLPQFLMENSFANNGKIGITQPRRIAAISLAQRVSQETGFQLGKEIGYQVRYDSTKTSKGNIIKFMTDGILLKEIASDFLLTNYSVIIIDEAHERSINTDILLGLLSRIVPLRKKKSLENEDIKELKLVIMSATLRIKDFTENLSLFKVPPPVISIDSRQYPVTIHFAKTTNCSDFMNQAFEKAKKIHRNLPPGGILIFVPGKKDVIALKSLLKSSLSSTEVEVLALYSMLSVKKQMKIFCQSEGKRFIVVSTNVAETSITIPNIVYVIDTGLEKRKIYSGQLQMSKFKITYISQASASQRSGRAGRTSPGHCYRLYSNAAFFNVFQEFREPDICTSPLSLIILQLKSIGIKNIMKFPFPSPPSINSLQESINNLEELGALKQCRKGEGDIHEITDLGKEIAEFPIAPRYGKMLAMGKLFHVEVWMCIIVAGMEIEQIFDMDFQGDAKEKLSNAKKQHSKWFNGKSDCLSTLRMFIKYAETGNTEEFSIQERIIEKSLIEMTKLCIQLMNLITGEKSSNLTTFAIPLPNPNQEILILKAIISGFIDQIALKVDTPTTTIVSKRMPYITQKHIDISLYPEDYKSSANNLEHAFIHPSSYFFRRSPPQIIAYQHLSFISRPSLLNITEVRNEWLYELGGNLLHDTKANDDAEGFYDKNYDKINTWVTASYGKQIWGLASAFIEFPECEKKYFWFLKHFLDGNVIGEGSFKQLWRVKTHKFTDKGIIRLQRALYKHNISSRKQLIEAVVKNNSFLIQELLQIAKEEEKLKVSAMWKNLGIL